MPGTSIDGVCHLCGLAAALVLLLGGRVAASQSRLWQAKAANCTLSPCYNAENLCGRFVEPCKLAGDPLEPSLIWVSAIVELDYDGRVFRRVERGASDLKGCERGDFWLEIVYKVGRQWSPILRGHPLTVAIGMPLQRL